MAPDVVAETFLVAWRRLDDVPADPLPWLYGVARRVLARLSERDRETLMLVVWEELSSARAARAAGCTRGAFAVRLHRARARFTAQLASLEPPAGGHVEAQSLEMS
jgi:RNA polymerase sigma-70 factor (ECF subfamily)